MPPNILFIFTDQQRFDTISALGAPIIKTPALDQLVRDGISFLRCYTPSPVCVSARYALLTGKPPHVTGCVDNKAIEQSHPTFIERLRDRGYRTHGVGKMHFVPNATDLRGFQTRDFSEPFGNDDYKKFLVGKGFGYIDEPFGVRSEYYYLPQVSQLPAKAHHSYWVADRSIEFLQNQPRDQPFFLWSSFIKPHPPFESPTPWNKLYRAAEMPMPYRPEGYQDQLCFWNHLQNRYKYRGAGIDDLLTRTIRAAYYSSISFIDFNIARILRALGDRIDQTYVVFASDHGEMLGDFGAFGKRCMLDGAARVPLIIRPPRSQTPGKQVSRPASLVDLHPTFLRIGRCELTDQHSENVDLMNLNETDNRRYVYSQFSENELGHYMVTDSTWKYSYCAADEKEWLHHITGDTAEGENLIHNKTYQEIADRLRAQLIKRFELSGYTAAVENGSWRKYGTKSVTDDPDIGLLLQDPAGLQAKVDELGPYRREIQPERLRRNAQILSAVVESEPTGG